MTLEDWMAGRRRETLRRAARQGVCVGALLMCALVWLGVREAAMPARAEAAREAVRLEQVETTGVTLKRLGLVAYLAKVRQNDLLATITGRPNSEDPCVGLADLPALPADSPCIANNESALKSVWRAALGPQAPPEEPLTFHDVWGMPILLNEAEYVCSRGDGWCPNDTLRSVGPDGSHRTADDMLESVVPFVYRKK
ncbi:hypothetical protein JCM15519_31390 [Fundidesulfovibrio butyratiphilus]